MTEREVAGQAEQDVEPDREDPEDHKALHQIRVARIELCQRAFGETGSE